MSNVPNTLPVPKFSLCVYCGSRPGHEPAYSAAAQAVGRWIGAHGGQLVYGGGRTGLMGQVAEATRRNLPALYLGYWIRDCRKMSYKSEYRPLELYINRRWETLT